MLRSGNYAKSGGSHLNEDGTSSRHNMRLFSDKVKTLSTVSPSRKDVHRSHWMSLDHHLRSHVSLIENHGTLVICKEIVLVRSNQANCPEEFPPRAVLAIVPYRRAHTAVHIPPCTYRRAHTAVHMRPCTYRRAHTAVHIPPCT